MNRAVPWVLLLFTLSGVSSLIYQFVWIRLLGHLLGGTSFAISTVLAAFMGGLALGSRHFGRRADLVAHPLKLYARLEVGIGVLGAGVTALIPALQPLWGPALAAVPAGLDPLVRIAVPLVLLVPPTFLMGGTLPVLGPFLVRERERLGRGLGLLYALNTAGAVLGAALSGFVLVQTLGIPGSTAVAVAGNLAIAGAILVIRRGGNDSLPRRVRTGPPSPGVAPEPRPLDGEATPLPAGVLAFVFGASGFAALGYEIYWTRALHHFLGNSTYAYSAMLTTFLLGMSAGGWVGGILADRSHRTAGLLGWIQILAGVTVLATVPLIWAWLPTLAQGILMGAPSMSWERYVIPRVGIAFLVMAPPTFLLGMTFPVVNRLGIRHLGRLGHGVGRLYFANTVGAILGSLAAGFLLLPAIGAKAAIVVTALLNVALGVLVHAAARPRPTRSLAAAAAAAVLLVVAAPGLLGVGRDILADSQTADDVVLFEREDPIAQTRVYEKDGGVRHMSVDGHRIGGNDEGILHKEKILAHLPLALVPEADDVLAIGLGSGITLGTLALYDEIERLTCVEIVPGVVEGARLFERDHGAVLDDPRVAVRVQDGIQVLLTRDERYDVISSDSKLNPEYVRNASLLARDYYELCRDRLTDEGVMVQWLAVHVPHSELRTIARSFAEAFPHAALFWHHPLSIVLAGSSAPIRFRYDRAERFALDRDVRADLGRLRLEEPLALASTFVMADDRLRHALGEGPVNTWMRPRVEFTIIRANLPHPRSRHEDDNLGWMLEHRDDSGLPLVGSPDPEAWSRYRRSAGFLLAGYSRAGGTGTLRPGEQDFRMGLTINPDDRRLRRVLRRVEGERARASRDREN